MPAVAESLAKLDAAWFDEVLRGGGHGQAAVTGVTIEPLAFSGAAADMARARLTYDDSGAAGPSTVIAKIRGADEQRVQMDAAMGLYDREARFYSEYADTVPVATPACYFAGDGTETPLLIEDLDGLRMGDQVEGLALADAERLIDALADLHARYWGDPPAGWLVEPADPTYAGMIGQLVAASAGALGDRFDGRVDEGVLATVVEHAPDWTAVLERCAEGPPTLTHNDCRLDNFFFRTDGEPVFVDWQIPARTRGTADVATLIAGSMDPELARANWEPLLRRYHERLVAGGVGDYSWEQCREHYRVSVIYPLSQGIPLIGVLDIGDGRGLGEAITLRALKQVEELDSFAAL